MHHFLNNISNVRHCSFNILPLPEKLNKTFIIFNCNNT